MNQSLPTVVYLGCNATLRRRLTASLNSRGQNLASYRNWNEFQSQIPHRTFVADVGTPEARGPVFLERFQAAFPVLIVDGSAAGGLDGIAELERIKEVDNCLPVIVLGDSRSLVEIGLARLHGAEAYCTVSDREPQSLYDAIEDGLAKLRRWRDTILNSASERTETLTPA